MEKLILKDKTEILVEGGTTTNKFTTTVVGTAGVKSLLDSLTTDNITSMELQNEAGIVCAVLENKEVENIIISKIQRTDNWRVSVSFDEKDMITQRLEKLEIGQVLHDNAIAEMSETVYV